MSVLNFKKKNKNKKYQWSIRIFLITFSLSLFFSITSESILKKSNLFVAFLIIFVLFFIGTVFDMIGVASAACNIDSFKKFCLNKNYLKFGIFLITKADKVSSFCCDIVGDMCGILSGSAGAAIVLKLSINESSLQIIISSLISSIIASIMVGLKSIGKDFAVKKSNKVVYLCSKILYNISNKFKKNAK